MTSRDSFEYDPQGGGDEEQEEVRSGGMEGIIENYLRLIPWLCLEDRMNL